MTNSHQEKAPLFEAMLDHWNRVRGNYHVPGHKQGRAFDSEGIAWFRSLLELDFTEVGELDDLHDPQSVIMEAQQLAAELFRADQTLFLVGGSTAGNLAVILHLCAPGDRIFIQRNCHQSVLHGCLLAHARPVLLPVEWDQDGRERPLSPETVKQALRQYPDVKAVLITSPSYYGWVQPVREIADVCHANGIPLIVDEAHGAHFGFHSSLPLSAMDLGADVAIQSTHKMLTSMTMSSMLHVRGTRVNTEEIARWLRVVESSSPSYPLMASLDLARRMLWKCGKSELERVLKLVQQFRERIQLFGHLREITFQCVQDPLKVNLQADHLSGYSLAKLLEEKGHYPELADHEKVLLVFSMGTTEEEMHRLVEVLDHLDRLWGDDGKRLTDRSEELKRDSQCLNSVDQEKQAMSPSTMKDGINIPGKMIDSLQGGQGIWEIKELPMDCMAAWRSGKKKHIPLDQASGRLSAQLVIPYPPGIPILFPGEKWTEERVQQVKNILEQGGKVRGVSLSDRLGGFLVDVL